MSNKMYLKLESLRENRKLSKKDVSLKLNIPYTTYCNYEYGYREPNRVILESLAKIYSVDIEYFYNDESTVRSENKSRLLSAIESLPNTYFDCHEEKIFAQIIESIKSDIKLMSIIQSKSDLES